MNVIISFVGLESHPESTPYPLRFVAGSTILGHILSHLLDLPLKKLALILESGQDLVRQWAIENVPDLDLLLLLNDDAADPFSALNRYHTIDAREPFLFIAGNYITEVDYLDFISSASPAGVLIQPEQNQVPGEELRLDGAGMVQGGGQKARRWAGSIWFSDSSQLAKALNEVHKGGDFGLLPLLEQLVAQGLNISSRQAVYCLDTRSVETMLYANARLLSLNLGSQDAIERSYAEDFTVLPPVFLHESAVIENSVIGPFVNLEAQASVRNSIVRNSLIGSGTEITNAILSNSLIGSNVQITGYSSTINADDGEIVEIGKIDDSILFSGEET